MKGSNREYALPSVLPAASTKELEEKEFVVDSGASMHMASKSDLDSAELETMRTSRRRPTARCKQEATVYVKELDLFVTVMLLEETPAVLSLGKLCEDHGYTYHWTSGQKPHLTQNGKRINCNISNYVPFVISGPSRSSLNSSSPTSQETVAPTEHPASTRSESMSEEAKGNSSRGPAETEYPNKK